MLDGDYRVSEANRLRPWGVLRWAAWLPEVANAFIVILTLLLVAASVLGQYSDAELAESLVDTYEPATWATLATYVVAAIGIGCAGGAWFVAESRRRRNMALFQAALLLLCGVMAAYEQHRLDARVARLQGAQHSKVP